MTFHLITFCSVLTKATLLLTIRPKWQLTVPQCAIALFFQHLLSECSAAFTEITKKKVRAVANREPEFYDYEILLVMTKYFRNASQCFKCQLANAHVDAVLRKLVNVSTRSSCVNGWLSNTLCYIELQSFSHKS